MWLEPVATHEGALCCKSDVAVVSQFWILFTRFHMLQLEYRMDTITIRDHI